MRYYFTILLLAGYFITHSQTSILSGEYFIDSDPGIGNATEIPGLSTGTQIDFLSNIDLSGLPVGNYQLGLRVQDETGLWSMTQTYPVRIMVSSRTERENITVLEYFFDTDPGLGQGISIPITTGLDVDVSSQVDASSLTPGMHTLYLRALSETNEWSITESTIVYVAAGDLLLPEDIVAMEYFFDTDPGIGNGMTIDISSAPDLDISEMIDVSGLDTGPHSLYVRVQSTTLEWSPTRLFTFYIEPDIDLSGLEYFIDADPGPGNGTPIQVEQVADTLEIDLVIPTASLAVGPHTVSARLGNDILWGAPETFSFSLCDGAIASFSANRVCEGEATTFTDLSSNLLVGDIYSWDLDGDGSEDSNTSGSISYTYTEPGLYDAELIIDRAGCPGIASGSIIVDTLVNLSATVPSTLQYGETIDLLGASSGQVQSYLWTTTGTGIFDDPGLAEATYTPSLLDGVAGSVTLTFSAVHPGTCQIEDITFDMEVILPPDLEILVYNAVSPNGDGKHDFMRIENIEAYPDNRVIVFNRWGETVQVIESYNNDDRVFTGVIRSKKLPPGTYYYEIDLGSGRNKIEGFVMLNY